jgi:hypothetical protein
MQLDGGDSTAAASCACETVFPNALVKELMQRDEYEHRRLRSCERCPALEVSSAAAGA